MGFRINTNIAALNAHLYGVGTNREINSSLEKLSSGLRINKAADDSSGLAIADSLRSQANALGQAVANANDAMGIIQTADKAMDEQIKILDTIKMKAIQAASDNQSQGSRNAIQKDVNRLVEQLDNIARTTSFNGEQLLNGKFSNKEFQVGAYSNQTIRASISNTSAVATGNITTRKDVVKLGNFGEIAPSVIGSPTVKMAPPSVEGLAVGDKIRIDGVGDYTLKSIKEDPDVAGGVIFDLDRPLEKPLYDATKISVIDSVQETFEFDVTTGQTIAIDDISGYSKGDTFTVTNTDGTTEILTIESVLSADPMDPSKPTAGTITLDQAATNKLSDGTARDARFSHREQLGTVNQGPDFVKYTIDGFDLPGVQLTSDEGHGTVGTGLGELARMVNESSPETGIRANALVRAESSIKIRGGALEEDLTINGVVILGQGDTILPSDIDNKVVNSINSNTADTGVTAALEADGTLTLTSDGRAMNLTGFNDVTGIENGVHAGTLEFTRKGLGVMDVQSVHYKDGELSKQNDDNAVSLTEIVDSHTLVEIANSRIRDEDPIGLLLTRDGAMLAMDISEQAITELDAVRADLGSSQIQLQVTINNISVTQVNVKAAESQIRDVDFAAESSTFTKNNILAQSGSYALSQANAVQQNVLKLLQ
jgi:flagellin